MEWTIETITQLVGSLGFPIICCGYMMITMNKTLKADTEATAKLATLVENLIEKLNVRDVD